MKKRELQALVEAQAAEIAALRRRVEALEARPPITIAPAPSVPDPYPWRGPWLTPGDTGHPPPWEWNKIWCDTVTA